MHNNGVHALDIQVFWWINGWSEQWKGLYVFFSEATKETPVRIGILVILGLLIAAGPTTRRAALISVVTLVMSNTLSDGFKHVFHMLRPCMELHENPVTHQVLVLRVGLLDSFGTASSHSANMAALAFVLVYYFKWWGAPWVLVAVLTGLSRIYVGVHYPSQVLLGYVCGVLCALLVIKTWEAFVRRREGKASLDVPA